MRHLDVFLSFRVLGPAGAVVAQHADARPPRKRLPGRCFPIGSFGARMLAEFEGKAAADIDPAQLVRPLKGIEYGCVPIAVRQELSP